MIGDVVMHADKHAYQRPYRAILKYELKSIELDEGLVPSMKNVCFGVLSDLKASGGFGRMTKPMANLHH